MVKFVICLNRHVLARVEKKCLIWSCNKADFFFFFFFFFQMGKIVESLQKQLESKGTEINQYRETHNLKIKGEENKEPEKQEKDSTKSGGVLVAKDT